MNARRISLFFICGLALTTAIACGPSLITQKSGLKYADRVIGTGPEAGPGDVVEVHYSGKLDGLFGSEFDNSRKRGRSFRFTLGKRQVIPGWELGVTGMKKGGKRLLVIPPQLAYGKRGAGKVIPPNATLRFEVELISFQKPPKPWPMEGKRIRRTSSGLKYIVYESGSGPTPKIGTRVTVHYSGYLTDGKMFDSSRTRGQPFSFPLGQGRVIKGWDEGIALMKPGAKYKFIIPAKLGYGSRPAGRIPPNSVLHFDVEFVK